MKSIPVALAIAVVLATTPAAVGAQGGGDDVRCLMVSNIFAKSAKEPKAKQIAQSAKLFYGGRASQLAAADIEAAMIAQKDRIDAANAGALMNACTKSMDQSLKTIQSTGQKLQAQKQ
ncbi:MAG: hypothetical protein M3Q08_03240 [Pseudomonadota bacterium]|nr:hypothetical protein [Pseudomonadota bacterium]